MADGGGEFSFFQDIHMRNDIRIDISISITHMTTTFGKQAHLHISVIWLIKHMVVTSLRQYPVAD